MTGREAEFEEEIMSVSLHLGVSCLWRQQGARWILKLEAQEEVMELVLQSWSPISSHVTG